MIRPSRTEASRISTRTISGAAIVISCTFGGSAAEARPMPVAISGADEQKNACAEVR